MVGLLAQIEAFLFTFILGMAAGLIFHYYQLVIRNLTLRRYSLYVLDFLLWVAMICVVSVGILLINQGEVRIYVFIALILGVVAYFRKLANHTSLALQKTAQASTGQLRKLNRGLRWPIQQVSIYIARRRHPPEEPPPIE